jgi:hypothetical protein
MGKEILARIGDNPLNELYELDRFYGWSSRIAIILSIVFPKRRIFTLDRIIPVILLMIILGLSAVLVALLLH